MEIRKTQNADLDEVMILFDRARKTMAELGIDQWQNGYPFRSDIERDIENGESYTVRENGEICAVFMLMKRREPTYDTVYGGEWKEKSEKYATVHRITVKPEMRRSAGRYSGEKSVSGVIMDFAKAFASENGLKSVKADTHEGNIAMRKMLERNGFVHCGTILLASGEKRVAYQFIL